MNEGKNIHETNEFKPIYIIFTDTSQDYLRNGYSGKNGNAKSESNRIITHKAKVIYEIRHKSQYRKPYSQ
jgi:hypothetical protein